jgi:hypothetical protein
VAQHNVENSQLMVGNVSQLYSYRGGNDYYTSKTYVSNIHLRLDPHLWLDPGLLCKQGFFFQTFTSWWGLSVKYSFIVKSPSKGLGVTLEPKSC